MASCILLKFYYQQTARSIGLHSCLAMKNNRKRVKLQLLYVKIILTCLRLQDADPRQPFISGFGGRRFASLPDLHKIHQFNYSIHIKRMKFRQHLNEAFASHVCRIFFVCVCMMRKCSILRQGIFLNHWVLYVYQYFYVLQIKTYIIGSNVRNIFCLAE